MFNRLIIIFLLVPLFYSCEDQSAPDAEGVIMAKGGVRYGGEFRFMSSEKVKSLFPLETTDIYSNRIVSQIFEGLLKIDPASTELIPSLAKETQVNENSTVFTFLLRDDVYFQDDACFEGGKGRKVTAKDFKYVLEFACSNHELNQLAYLLKDKVKGADTYYNGETDNVEGIQVKDDHTLVIELKSPFSGFKKVLTHAGLSLFPKEAFDKYGIDIRVHPVGTGAFGLDVFTDDKIVLGRNDHYWGKDDFGNPLPFLDKIIMTYSKDKTDELLSFRAEKIDLVLDIPVEEVENVLGTLNEAQAGENVKHIVDSKSSMSITYYGFAHESEAFSKKEVRQAFNMAVDRKSIIDNWLEGEGWPALNGFVPRMKGYPSSNVKGYTYDVEQAKKLMAQAGYANGNGFPTLDLYVNALKESGGHKLAKAVSKSLKENLGVNVNIELVAFEEREKLILDGTAIFWRAGWVADYPDPENFLNLFYSGNIGDNSSAINPFKYKNDEFDAMFEKALAETDDEKRMELFAKCDQIIIDDAAVMPLVTDDFVTMVNLKVRKFVTNEVEQLDFSRIFIKEIN
jgi:peptide/nickel transport system substrate-binding protein